MLWEIVEFYSTMALNLNLFFAIISHFLVNPNILGTHCQFQYIKILSPNFRLFIDFMKNFLNLAKTINTMFQ